MFSPILFAGLLEKIIPYFPPNFANFSIFPPFFPLFFFRFGRAPKTIFFPLFFLALLNVTASNSFSNRNIPRHTTKGTIRKGTILANHGPRSMDRHRGPRKSRVEFTRVYQKVYLHSGGPQPTSHCEGAR